MEELLGFQTEDLATLSCSDLQAVIVEMDIRYKHYYKAWLKLGMHCGTSQFQQYSDAHSLC